jgi:hypothetical protein
MLACVVDAMPLTFFCARTILFLCVPRMLKTSLKKHFRLVNKPFPPPKDFYTKGSGLDADKV